MEIFIKKDGRLGNNLFQYFFGKILAQETNSNLYTNFTLPELFGLQTNFQFSPFPNSCGLEEEWNNDDYVLKFNGKEIDKNIEIIIENLKISNCEKLFVSGYYQNFDFYEKYTDMIKGSFKCTFGYVSDTLGIHVRKDDITNSVCDLPDEWFLQMVEKFPKHKKYVTSDSPNCKLVKKLIDLGCELYHDTPENTIQKFAGFSDLVLSQGTFSWWMAFLSKGKNHFLIPKTGWNSESAPQKLLPKLENWFYYKLDEHSQITNVGY